MIQLNLNQNDLQILTQLLESCITDLRGEIRETDNFEYKMMLKERKGVLTKLYDAVVNAENEMTIAE